MKTIQILKTLINILYYTLLSISGVGIIFLIFVLFFNDSLPFFLQGYKMLIGPFFNWKLVLIPITTVINYILFVLGVYNLRKTIKHFVSNDFYTKTVINSLNRAGKLFVFIGVSTILIRLLSVLLMQNIILVQSSWWLSVASIAASLDLINTFLIIIGLFLLLFSKVFENANELKQENDLTL